MSANDPVPPPSASTRDYHPVTLSGLFTASERLRAELHWGDFERYLHFTCFRGSVQVEITRGAGPGEVRRDMVAAAGAVISAAAHVDETLHEAGDPTIWGSYVAHGTFMETPVFVYTTVSPTEANRLGWGNSNVIELPLEGGAR